MKAFKKEGIAVKVSFKGHLDRIENGVGYTYNTAKNFKIGTWFIGVVLNDGSTCHVALKDVLTIEKLQV